MTTALYLTNTGQVVKTEQLGDLVRVTVDGTIRGIVTAEAAETFLAERGCTVVA